MILAIDYKPDTFYGFLQSKNLTKTSYKIDIKVDKEAIAKLKNLLRKHKNFIEKMVRRTFCTTYASCLAIFDHG